MTPARNYKTTAPPGDTLVACRDLALQLLTQSLEGFFTQLEATFFDLAEDTHDMQLRDTYFAARAEAQSKKNAILGAFRQQFLETFNQRLQGNHSKAGFYPVNKALGELSLVANDDYEESLTASHVADSLKNKGGDTLHQLEQRLARLMPDSRDASASNPLSPDAIAEAVMAACRMFESGIGARLAAMRAFETELSDQVTQVYQHLNQFLIQENVQPVSHRAVLNRGRAPGQAPYDPNAQQANADAGMAAGQGNDQFQGYAPNQYPGQYGASSQQGQQGYMMTPELAAHLQQLAAGNMQAQARSSLRPEWFSFLDNLQRDPPGAAQQGTGLPENLLSVLRSTRWVNELNRVDTMTFDLVSMLFDRLFEDERLPNAIKGLLARLQIPVLKVSLLDGSFFARKSHPARQLIDLLEDSFRDWQGEPDDTDPTFAKFNDVVSWINTHFEDEVGVFDTALADIKRFLADADELAQLRANQAAEDLLRHEVSELATATAESLVQARLARAAEVPLLVSDFLGTWWSAALANAWGPHGEAEAEFVLRQKAMDDLIWSLAPKRGPEERLQLVNLLPSMLKVLEHGATSAGMPSDASKAFFSELVNCHAAAIRNGLRQAALDPLAPANPAPGSAAAAALAPAAAPPAQISPVAAVAAQPAAPLNAAVPGQTLAGAPVTTPASPIVAAVVTPVSVAAHDVVASGTVEYEEPAEDLDSHIPARGEWVNWLDNDGHERRLRLSWISPLGTRYLFTNRQGENGLALTRPEVEAHLASGRLQRLNTDESATERALNQLKEQLVQ
ncbi:DUF1631 family protein [Amantichitinum ursilacus]|uniref:DUF1631 domain-containing protein n=1 Tax=Amantichitinum ursilacus TaxID=857265 RepID=A0A0N0XLD0_9NEIS|nr:DUF1631 family protein [Amantichitinum ursilacus]KPC55367.1 hypothetical protein WG78_01880 [Amantichitinum ursilacus]